MRDYQKMRDWCAKQSQLSEQAIDKFLIYFITYQENLKKELDRAERKYKHIIRKLPAEFFPRVSAEFIVGQAFMEKGLLQKYKGYPFHKHLSSEEVEYLNFQLANPWRYTFCRIVNRPEDEFFEMRDEISGDELLIYSPGIELYCKAGHEFSLYFLLLQYNGECWQSFGLIAPFRSFNIDDIYIYATEVFPEVDDDESFMKSVYKNPFPYFMLLIGQEARPVVSGKFALRHYVAEQEISKVNIDSIKEIFKVQWNKGIYQFTNEQMRQPPHFANAYYVEKTKLLYRYAMTHEGFKILTFKLMEVGLAIDEEEDYSISVNMVSVLKTVLKRDFPIHKYEKYFPDSKSSDIPSGELSRINKFLAELLPYINTGEEPDLYQLGAKHSLSGSDARDMYEALKQRIQNMFDK